MLSIEDIEISVSSACNFSSNSRWGALVNGWVLISVSLALCPVPALSGSILCLSSKPPVIPGASNGHCTPGGATAFPLKSRGSICRLHVEVGIGYTNNGAGKTGCGWGHSTGTGAGGIDSKGGGDSEPILNRPPSSKSKLLLLSLLLSLSSSSDLVLGMYDDVVCKGEAFDSVHLLHSSCAGVQYFSLWFIHYISCTYEKWPCHTWLQMLWPPDIQLGHVLATYGSKSPLASLHTHFWLPHHLLRVQVVWPLLRQLISTVLQCHQLWGEDTECRMPAGCLVGWLLYHFIPNARDIPVEAFSRLGDFQVLFPLL